jgi:hypothetical protein
MNEYETQAQDFLTKHGIEFKAEFKRFGKHFQDDESSRDIYDCTFKRNNKSFTVTFGQSIANSRTFEFQSYPLVVMSCDGSFEPSKHFPTNRKLAKDTSVEAYRLHKKGTPPTAYDILACLTKYDPRRFNDFCDEFGYDNDSIKARDTYEAVRDEWYEVDDFFSDEELDELREIN